MPRDEEWATLDGFPNYLVSNRGAVMSRRSGTILTPTRTRDGHLRVTLTDGGRTQQVLVKKLVAMMFHPEYREGVPVKNQNGDLDDNSVGNLYVRRLDRRPIRYRRQGAWGARVRIRETGVVVESAREAARHIGGDYSTVYRCLRGEREKHMGYSFEYVEDDFE